MPAQHGDGKERRFAVCNFATAVGGHWLEEVVCGCRVREEHFVIDRRCAHEHGVSAAQRIVEAQQSNYICRVGVECLALGGLVDAYSGVGSIGAGVLDVSEQMSVGILEPGNA